MIKQCPRLAVNRRRRAISPARGLRWKRGTVGARQRTTCCGQRSWPGRSFPFRAPVPRGLLLLLLYKSARAPRRLGLPPRRLLSPSPPSRQQTQSRSSRASSDVSLSPVAVRRQPKHLARGARSSSPHQIFFYRPPSPASWFLWFLPFPRRRPVARFFTYPHAHREETGGRRCARRHGSGAATPATRPRLTSTS
jgi:hypothetical protein